MQTIPCAPACCPPVQTVSIPGIDGDPGAPGANGADGADGVNAFTTTTANFNVPAAAGGSVTISVVDSSWMAIGQTLVVDGPATFIVTAVPTGITVTLQWDHAAGDVGGGTLITSPAKVSPAGVPGTLGGAVTKSSPANPTGTADTTGKMMGLAGTVTPSFSGRVLIAITGMMGNGAIGDGASVQIRYGTGAAPANADALTGTTLGKLKNMVASTAAGIQGVALAYVVTGLTIGTAYWIDVGLKAVTGNTATIYDVDIVAVEL